MRRRFQSHTDTTPVQFISELRLGESKRLLIMGFPINKAAIEVGFNSSSRYSRVFKKKFGESPRDDQKRMINEWPLSTTQWSAGRGKTHLSKDQT